MESLETTADYEFALDKEGVRVINFDESTEKKEGWCLSYQLALNHWPTVKSYMMHTCPVAEIFFKDVLNVFWDYGLQTQLLSFKWKNRMIIKQNINDYSKMK